MFDVICQDYDANEVSRLKSTVLKSFETYEEACNYAKKMAYEFQKEYNEEHDHSHLEIGDFGDADTIEVKGDFDYFYTDCFEIRWFVEERK